MMNRDLVIIWRKLNINGMVSDDVVKGMGYCAVIVWREGDFVAVDGEF